MFKKSLSAFLFLTVFLSITASGIAQEKKGLELAKQLAKDIIAGDYRNITILAVKETLGEQAVLELSKELNYAGIPFTFQEIELGTAPELRRTISSILRPEIAGIVPLGDESALQSIIAQMRNLGVEQPVLMYTTTEEGTRILKEKEIMPTYTTVLELQRSTKEDILFLKNGDKLTGTVLNPSLEIRTSYADLSFDTRLIAGITLEAEAYMERIYTVNQNLFSGFMSDPAIEFKLSSGSEVTIRKEKIAKIIFRVREKELRGIPRSDVLFLTNGDIFTGKVTDKTLQVKTTYADIPVKVDNIQHIAFIAGENVLTRIILNNNDQVQGILQNDDINIELDAGPPITVYKDRIKEINMRMGYDEPIEVSGMGVSDLAFAPEEAASEDMVLIPAGEFIMGSNDGDDDEKPVHRLYLDAYYIDKYEVTNAQFCKFLNEKGNQKEGGTTWLDIGSSGCLIDYISGQYHPKPGYEGHPVVMVSWYGARAYAKWADKRLPTEAEWEKAARGSLVGKKYPWGDSIDFSRANYDKNMGRSTPVGSYPANGYGLYDMAGNVWEWVSDWYDENYYSRSPDKNPRGPDNPYSRDTRGGGWGSSAWSLRCANRSFYPPRDVSNTLGFRCAKPP